MKDAIWLIGVGWFNAKRADKLKVGEYVVYNYGYSNKIISFVPSKTGKTIKYVVSDEKGNTYSGTWRSSTLKAFQEFHTGKDLLN